MEEITKEEILEVLAENGLSVEQAEKLLEIVAQGGATSILGILELAISKLENATAKSIATMTFAALKPTAVEAIEAIDINL